MKFPYYLVFRNGQTVAADPAAFVLHDSSAEFLRKPRVFTTFVAYRRPFGGNAYEVPYLIEHGERLIRDASRFFGVKPIESLLGAAPVHHAPRGALTTELTAQVVALLRMLERSDCAKVRVRVVLGTDALECFVDQYQPRWSDDRSCTLFEVSATREHPLHKTTSTEASRKAQEVALAAGADEALLVDDDGRVLEGAWSNLFWFDETGRLFTREHDVLPGIVRRVILERFPCHFATRSVAELLREASECFLTRSTEGITPVSSINEKPIGAGALGPQTRRLRDAMRDAGFGEAHGGGR